MLDTGFTNDRCQIGVMLDEENYRVLRDHLRSLRDATVRTHDAELHFRESGLGTVGLVGLDGSEVGTRIVNAGANYLGVCYLHRLTEFSVFWDLAGQLMIISRTGAPAST